VKDRGFSAVDEEEAGNREGANETIVSLVAATIGGRCV
jgi:hypothetical protein